MDRSTTSTTTRRAFLARLPHLAAGGALVLVTVGAMARGGRGDGDCTQAPACRSCAVYRGCDLPRARAARAGALRSEAAGGGGASRREVADG